MYSELCSKWHFRMEIVIEFLTRVENSTKHVHVAGGERLQFYAKYFHKIHFTRSYGNY